MNNQINKYDYLLKINYCSTRVFLMNFPCLLMCTLLYFSFIRLHVCAYAIHSMIHCGSAFEPGASGLPHYCTPPVCVPDVLGALAVWQLSTNKKISEVPNPTNAYSVFTNSQLVCQIGSQNQFNKPMPAARRGVYLYKTKKYITCMHL